MNIVIQILAAIAGSVAGILSLLLFTRLSWPSPALWFLKLYVSAFSYVLALIGFFVLIAGLATGSVFISIAGLYCTLVYVVHIIRVTRPPHPSENFEHAFGRDWKTRIQPGQKQYMLKTRTVFRLPHVPKPRFEQNIPFITIPGTEKPLLCDIWQAPETVKPSGLAFIYLHGSAWYMLDKDTGTRPMFSQLAAQGHLVMDVAYRLAPETDLMGMITDVKHSIAWLKENAATYSINPDRIIVGGGSAGGHLAMMAAYTSGNPQFTAKELEGKDTGVKAVISIYGPSDLEAMYYHTNQHLTTRSAPGRPQKPVPKGMPEWMIKKMGKEYYRLHLDKGFVNAGSFAPLLGGHPDECPETYSLFSPLSHIHAGCPPTLLIHGEHDVMAPVNSTRKLYERLAAEKVPAILHILPQTDHAFDMMSVLSPSAHNALYDMEYFMALLT